MGSLLQDLRYGFRFFAKSKTFTIAAIMTLGLGIGISTAMFSVIYGVLLSQLPYRDASRLIIINMADNDKHFMPAIGAGHYRDIVQRNRVFDEVASASGFETTLDSDGIYEAEEVSVGFATHNLMPLLGYTPIVGRNFTEEEARFNGPRAVLLGHDIWQRRFGGDRGVVGRLIKISGQESPIVGVLPPDFKIQVPNGRNLPERPPDLWLAQQLNYDQIPRNAAFLVAIGRLKPEANLAAAQADLDRLGTEFRNENQRDKESNFHFQAVPLLGAITDEVRRPLWILFGAVGFVLLIACGNVANLLLARANERQREIAVRVSLGATRGRIVRQVLTESLLLGVCGTVLGLGIAQAAIILLTRLGLSDLPRVENIHLSLPVLLFSCGVCFLTSLIFGLVPAFRVANVSLTDSLKEGSKAAVGSSKRGLQRALVAAEIALSVVLLVGAGLMLRTLGEMQKIDLGYKTENVLTFRVNIPFTRYNSPALVSNFIRQFEDRLRALPGIQSVGAVTVTPLTGKGVNFGYATEDNPTEWGKVGADARNVTPGYFEAMGIPLVEGRLLNEHDDLQHPLVILVDADFAKKVWPNQSPLGRKLLMTAFGPNPGPPGRQWFEVVGTVKHVRNETLTEVGAPQIYKSEHQQPFNGLTFVMKTSADPNQVISAARSELQGLDRNIAMSKIRLLDEYVDEAMAGARGTSTLLGIFSLIALLMASVGLYGVISLLVSQQTREIGLRMALGAQRSDVLKLVVGQGLALLGIGLFLGLAVALAVGRLMKSLVYGVSTSDPTSLAVVMLLLLVVGAVASYLPARRATRVEPMIALRYE